MDKIAIINASPIICLSKIGEVQLLFKVFDKVIIPALVVDEILSGVDEDPAKKFLLQELGKPIRPNWYDSNAINLNKDILAWNLGKGETHVLSLAMEKQNAIVVIDDKAARTCSKIYKIMTVGTIGVILLAKQKAIINSVIPLLKRITSSGLRIDKSLLIEVCKLAEEQWVE